MKIERLFPEKRIIITGSGSGLGRALALEFASRGWRIVVADINKERIAESAAMVRAAGGTVMEVHCDVTVPASLEKLRARVLKAWGGLDILVNNAGIAGAGYMEKIPIEEWNRIIDINLRSVIYGCRSFIPVFRNQGGGYIVNVASNAGIASLPEMASYNVTKAGVISLSETLCGELAPAGIGVSVVCPTFFKTNLMDGFSSPDPRQRLLAERFFEKSKTTSEQIARHIIRSIEKKRLYVITQADGRFTWRAKRLFPVLYFKGLSWGYRKGIIDRLLGLKN